MKGIYGYYNNARFRDAILAGTFYQQDPLAEKYYPFTPYHYAAGNPVRFIDPDGRESGDWFRTTRDAAKDFGKCYNGKSIESKQEYAASIYELNNPKKGNGYTYSPPAQGRDGKSVENSVGPPNSKQVGFVHSHANSREGGVVEDNNFSGSYNNDKKINTPQENKGITSDSDIGVYNVTNKLGYVSTPNGSLQEYNPTTGEVTTISTMMPSDPNDPSRENTINTNGIPAPIPPSLPDLYRNLPKLP